jgi:hypothetical protein
MLVDAVCGGWTLMIKCLLLRALGFLYTFSTFLRNFCLLMIGSFAKAFTQVERDSK